MAYSGFITTLKDVRKHTNADRLQVATVFGNDVVVSLDYKVGDVVIYFPTDGQLGVEYVKENKLSREDGGYLDPKKRNVTTIKLRGEKSDGLLMKVDSLKKFTKVEDLKDGDKIDILNGVVICEKYIPFKPQNKQMPNQKEKVKKENIYPLFAQHIDTPQLAYDLGKFKVGDDCIVTLKMHGTSQRTAYTVKDGKKGLAHKLIKFLFGTNGLPKKWEVATGTRRVNLQGFDGGFYGDNAFRKQWHDLFDGKLEKGETVYYEVVGYTDSGALIMPECDNKKLKDKEFVKQYGDTTKFTYGCNYGQSDIYVYRMTMTNEDGFVVEYPWDLVKLRCEQMGVKFTPELERFKFTTKEDLLERVNRHTDGVDPIGKTHLREGSIVRIEGREKFTALKHKSFDFKVLEGIIKTDASQPDMEEAESTF